MEVPFKNRRRRNGCFGFDITVSKSGLPNTYPAIPDQTEVLFEQQFCRYPSFHHSRIRVLFIERRCGKCSEDCP